MTIDSTFVKEIAKHITENKVERIQDHLGREYFTSAVHLVKGPTPEPIEVSSLNGLVDIIESECLECSVFVESPSRVVLKSALDSITRQRECYAVAKARGNNFPFGREMEIDDFIMKLQCNFVDSTAKTELIKLVSSITSSDIITAEDDGLSQSVITKSEISHKKVKKTVEPNITLKPYRTFREIDQPGDRFLTRTHKNGSSLPLVSLRSSGGNLWENDAVESIHEYLSSRLDEKITIIR